MLKLADFGLAIDMNEERAVTRAGTLVSVRLASSINSVSARECAQVMLK